MSIVVSIDPGKSSGYAVLGGAAEGVDLLAAFQTPGGVTRFRETVTDLQLRFPGATWISEKFSPRSGQGFNQTLDSTLPLVCEGVLIDRNLLPVYDPREKQWRNPALQYLVGGTSKNVKKARMHKFLKDSGFYVAPSALGTTDADDFRSACAHGLAYLQRELKHRGVHAMVSEWMEKN